MKFFAMALRFWSYLFALLLGVFCAGIALVLLISGAPNYRLDMLPWFKGSAAVYALLVLGLFGAVSAVLAFAGKAKPLLAVFCILAFVLMGYGYFLSPQYRFSGASEAWGALLLTFGAIGASFGALMQFQKRRA